MPVPCFRNTSASKHRNTRVRAELQRFLAPRSVKITVAGQGLAARMLGEDLAPMLR